MLEHLPLGYGALASAPAACDSVLQLAGLARTQGGRLAWRGDRYPRGCRSRGARRIGLATDPAEQGAVIPAGSAPAPPR